MSPHETLFLKSTGSMPDAPGPEVQLIDHNPWLRLEVWDMPGDFRFEGMSHKHIVWVMLRAPLLLCRWRCG